MLLDKARNLSERITRYQTLREQAHNAQTFETRANQFEKAASGLNNAVSVMKALNESGIPVVVRLSTKDQTRKKTESLLQGFRGDTAFVDNPGFDLRFEFLTPLKGLADSVASTSLGAWQKNVDARRERVSQDILNALKAVPAYRPIVAKVQNCQVQIEAIANSLPTDVASANLRVTEIASEQREAWRQLTGGELPEDVILFLRASMGDGAELRLLTAAVIDWLKSRGLDGAFRIKPRNVV